MENEGGEGKRKVRRREARSGKGEERDGEKKGNLPPLKFRSGYGTAQQSLSTLIVDMSNFW